MNTGRQVQDVMCTRENASHRKKKKKKITSKTQRRPEVHSWTFMDWVEEIQKWGNSSKAIIYNN